MGCILSQLTLGESRVDTGQVAISLQGSHREKMIGKKPSLGAKA